MEKEMTKVLEEIKNLYPDFSYGITLEAPMYNYRTFMFCKFKLGKKMGILTNTYDPLYIDFKKLKRNIIHSIRKSRAKYYGKIRRCK